MKQRLLWQIKNKSCNKKPASNTRSISDQSWRAWKRNVGDWRWTYIESSHCPSRISRNHLYLHTEVAEQVRSFRLEPSTCFQKQKNDLGIKKKFSKNVLILNLPVYLSRWSWISEPPFCSQYLLSVDFAHSYTSQCRSTLIY